MTQLRGGDGQMKDETTATEVDATTEPSKKTTTTKVRSTIAAIASLCTVGASIASVAAPRKWH